jgi:voltage-gated potassium channel
MMSQDFASNLEKPSSGIMPVEFAMNYATRLRKSKNRLILSLSLFLGLICFGTLGYITLTGSSVFEALYMTIISITTTGYGETIDIIHNKSARVFTMFLLLCGMGITVYFASYLTAFLVEGELKNILTDRRMNKDIGHLKNHLIIAGGGQTALYAIEELLTGKRPFVIIEKDEEAFAYLREYFDNPNLLCIIGDATDDEVLLEAGILHAEGLLTTLPEDRDNLFVTITARGLNPGLRIIAKIVHQNSAKKMRTAGANDVVCPDSIGGLRMVSQMMHPHVVQFLDTMMRIKSESIRIEEVKISGQCCNGKTLKDLRLPEQFGNMLVLALLPQGEHEAPLYNPVADSLVNSGDTLVVLGNINWINKARSFFAS